MLQIPQQENTNYTFALAVGNIIAANYIRKNAANEERKKKIDRVLCIKKEALAALIKENFDEPLEPLRPDRAALFGFSCAEIVQRIARSNRAEPRNHPGEAL